MHPILGTVLAAALFLAGMALLGAMGFAAAAPFFILVTLTLAAVAWWASTRILRAQPVFAAVGIAAAWVAMWALTVPTVGGGA